MVGRWNSLDQEMVDAASVNNAFKGSGWWRVKFNVEVLGIFHRD